MSNSESESNTQTTSSRKRRIHKHERLGGQGNGQGGLKAKWRMLRRPGGFGDGREEQKERHETTCVNREGLARGLGRRGEGQGQTGERKKTQMQQGLLGCCQAGIDCGLSQAHRRVFTWLQSRTPLADSLSQEISISCFVNALGWLDATNWRLVDTGALWRCGCVEPAPPDAIRAHFDSNEKTYSFMGDKLRTLTAFLVTFNQCANSLVVRHSFSPSCH